jgi:hypothetical protein
MPNDKLFAVMGLICPKCGKQRAEHSMVFRQDGRVIETCMQYVSVPVALLDAVRELMVEVDNYDLSLCAACKRLNPQHANCTSCKDRDDLIKAQDRVRAMLDQIKGA